MTDEMKVDVVTRLMQISVKAKATNGTDVFVNYAPHINGVDVGVHNNGWCRGKSGINMRTLCFDRTNKKDISDYFAELETLIASGLPKEELIKQAEIEIAQIDNKKKALRRKIKKLEESNGNN